MEKNPSRISSEDWDKKFLTIPQEYKDSCRYLRDLVPGGVPYLYSHHEYSCRGDTLLRRLKFDSGLASLRLWSFLFSEKDRLFLAREKGWKVVAVMKDLGQVPVLAYAMPNALTFYADELWWAPCFSEEPHLLDEAEKLGATRELCYVRAALGAYESLDYFPKPDLSIAGVGACCDDFSAVMQLIEWRGNPIHWWEIPARLENKDHLCHKFAKTPHGGSDYQISAVDFLEKQYQGIVDKLSELCGVQLTDAMLRKSVHGFNQIRGKVAELRRLVYGAKRPPLPGLEMLLAEFIALHYCSEPEESLHVLDDLLDMVRYRLDNDMSPLHGEPLRIYWVTPPTDAALVTLLEDLGGCICGTEYMISHSFIQLDETKPPVRAVAENYMDDPMIGSSEFRARRIVEEARRNGAEGVLISGIFGASHCAFEERVVREMVQKELDIPVLAFDVPYSPGRLSEQVVTRMQGFMEVLRERRGASSVSNKLDVSGEKMSSITEMDPLEYFNDAGMDLEVDTAKEAKSHGRGIVGIYCEFTPRDLILAAGAYPVCLCGTSQKTIPAAETVLPANLCPLIKSSFGFVITNRCAFVTASDLIVAETTCDGKKKMYEILGEKKPMHVLELTQKVDEERAFKHWLEEVDSLKKHLEEIYKREITNEDLKAAIRTMNNERKLLLEAYELGKQKPSIVSGLELSAIRYRMAGLPQHQTMLAKFIDKIRTRAATGYTAAPLNAPRVILTGTPTGHGSEKIIEIIEECGGIVVAQENCSGIKPLVELVSEEGDPLEAIARKHFHLPCSCMTPNTGRNDLLRQIKEEYQADAVVDLVWHSCHTYNVEAYLVERFCSDELGIPYLKIETDYSDSDREQIRVRVQTMLEIAKDM